MVCVYGVQMECGGVCMCNGVKWWEGTGNDGIEWTLPSSSSLGTVRAA